MPNLELNDNERSYIISQLNLISESVAGRSNTRLNNYFIQETLPRLKSNEELSLDDCSALQRFIEFLNHQFTTLSVGLNSIISDTDNQEIQLRQSILDKIAKHLAI
jgi:hypothetical protein